MVDSREAAVSQPNWEFYWEQSASVEQADLIHNYSQLIHNAQGRFAAIGHLSRDNSNEPLINANLR